jgi:hypothetical protein
VYWEVDTVVSQSLCGGIGYLTLRVTALYIWWISRAGGRLSSTGHACRRLAASQIIGTGWPEDSEAPHLGGMRSESTVRARPILQRICSDSRGRGAHHNPADPGLVWQCEASASAGRCGHSGLFAPSPESAAHKGRFRERWGVEQRHGKFAGFGRTLPKAEISWPCLRDSVDEVKFRKVMITTKRHFQALNLELPTFWQSLFQMSGKDVNLVETS